jgi:DNA-binding transcriptional LysR family regulator
MKIEPRYLVQLATVIECGTLNEAAVRLGTTQPALSRTIAMLERQVGAPLFERRRRPLVPTAIGRELADYGRAIKVTTDQAATWAANLATGDVGTIRVGAPPFHCDRLLSRMIAAFLHERPAVRITLSADYLPMLQTKLIDDRVDMIVCPVALLQQSPDLTVERLMEDVIVIVSRPGHPLLTKRRLIAADLEAATWISHATGSTLHADMLTALGSGGIDSVGFPFQSDSAGAIVTQLQSTDCLTMLPRNAVLDHVANGELAIVPFALSLPKRSIAMVNHAQRVVTPAMAAFKAFLRAQFQALRDQMNVALATPAQVGESSPRHYRRNAGRRPRAVNAP